MALDAGRIGLRGGQAGVEKIPSVMGALGGQYLLLACVRSTEPASLFFHAFYFNSTGKSLSRFFSLLPHSI